MVSLKTLIESFEKLWPNALTEPWDRPGLMVGDPRNQVHKVVLAVDATTAVIEEAIEAEAQLLLTHHPLLLKGVSELGSDTVKGHLVSLAVLGELAIFAAHTNADISEVGTARALADAVGLRELAALDPTTGHGLVGELQAPESLLSLSTRLARILPSVAAGLKVAGDPEQMIRRVGLAPGAGDGFLGAALSANVDLFITSDLRHHPAQDFMEQNQVGAKVALMDISHWAAESLWLPLAQKELQVMHPDIEFVLSDVRTDPWDFAVTQ